MHALDIALTACINGNSELSESILRNYPEQNDPRIIFNLGWHEMRHGNIAAGLSMMDAGRFINVFGLPSIPGPIWRDEVLNGKTLLFRCENGLGDQIMNFRFAEKFKELGATVVISCAKELMPLFNRHGYVSVANDAAHHVYYNYWIPSMSAAHMLGYDTGNFPGQAYLTAAPKVLYSKPNTLKIGIRWAGNPKFEHEQHRKFDPQPLIDLHELPNTTLYSLQRDEDLVDGLPFADLRDQMKTFEDTASIIQGLDLVITSCTSIAHLSAALGKETWIIIPIMPYYPWAAPGEKSVWYDSVRLFRQTKYGDWSEPMNSVRSALLEKVKDYNVCKSN